MKKKYQIILADCPWSYNDKLSGDPVHGGITYPVLETEDLKKLPVKDLADKDCALFMWVTMPMIQQGLDVIKAWGFKYSTCAFAWVKQNPKGEGIWFGLGHWTGSNIELCLIARRGAPKRVIKNMRQIVMAPRSRHSAKPPEIKTKIVELMGDKKRIELFGRELTPGWTVIGNEVTGNDIRIDLENIINGKK